MEFDIVYVLEAAYNILGSLFMLYFYEPTVLSGVEAGAECYREETFGPVVSVYTFRTDDEAVELANDSRYGLNASVWSRSASRGRRVGGQVRAGTVNVNEAFAAATLGELAYRLTGSSDLYESTGRRPNASINFVTCHDGFTLKDLVSYNEKHNYLNGEENRDGTDNNRSWNCGVEGATTNPSIRAHRRRQIRNHLSTTILSAGVPMFVAGDEMGRTQKGNNNAYCQDNEINWVNWHRTEWQDSLFDFTAYLIRLRQEHKVFQRSGYLRGEPKDFVHVPDIAWLRADATRFDNSVWESFDTRCIGMYLGGGVTNRRNEYDVVDNAFYWFLNSSDKPVDVTLPSEEFGLKYQLMFDTKDEQDWDKQEELDAGTVVTLAPWSSALWLVTLLAIATPQK